MTDSVAIIGSGLIGRAWAMIFARAGWDVRLFDAADSVAQAAIPLCAEGFGHWPSTGSAPIRKGPRAASALRKASPPASTVSASFRRTGRNGST